MTHPIGLAEIQPLIVARLQVEVPAAREVIDDGQLSHLDEAKQVTPAIHVVHLGWAPGKRSDDGNVQQVIHRYMVAAAVDNRRKMSTGSGARAAAGPLLDGILAAMLGWSPGPGVSTFHLVAGSAPAYTNGYAYFPLGWECRTVHRGTC